MSTPFGCVLGGYLMDAIGRKLTLMFTEVPLILGWLLISSATSVHMIYGKKWAIKKKKKLHRQVCSCSSIRFSE